MKPLTRIVIATRESALAMWQARNIQQRLAALYLQTEITILGMTTSGDRMLDSTLAKSGGKGLFVKELEQALSAGEADIAVHSMKDVPMELPQGFVIAAITEREDPRDAFVSNQYATLAALPAGARIGTSSLRRQSQICERYPALRVEPLRGNVQTRLKKLDDGGYAAIILAAAGLKRLGLAHRISCVLPTADSLPAPGQGALAVECRADRAEVVAMTGALNHAPTAACVRAERALSRALSGSCQLPLAAYAEDVNGRIRLRGVVATPDGSRVVRGELTGASDQAETLGAELAATLKANGAAEILAGLASL